VPVSGCSGLSHIFVQSLVGWFQLGGWVVSRRWVKVADPRPKRVVCGQPARRQFWGALGFHTSSALVPYTVMNKGVYVATLRRHLLPLLTRKRGLLFQQVSVVCCQCDWPLLTLHTVRRTTHRPTRPTASRPSSLQTEYASCSGPLSPRISPRWRTRGAP